MIRQASQVDLSTLYRIEKKCFGRRSFSKSHLVWLLKIPYAQTHLYAENGRDVGAIILKREGEVARVVSVAVLPAYRRRGVGTELMDLAERIMESEGCREIKLEVSVHNEGAIAFYRRLGYDVDGRLEGYYSWGEDAFSMGKPLDGGG